MTSQPSLPGSSSSRTVVVSVGHGSDAFSLDFNFFHLKCAEATEAQRRRAKRVEGTFMASPGGETSWSEFGGRLASLSRVRGYLLTEPDRYFFQAGLLFLDVQNKNYFCWYKSNDAFWLFDNLNYVETNKIYISNLVVCKSRINKYALSIKIIFCPLFYKLLHFPPCTWSAVLLGGRVPVVPFISYTLINGKIFIAKKSHYAP